MTNEEFNGHLMAALHGPQAIEIALRVGRVLLDAFNSDDFKAAMAEYAKENKTPTETLAEALGVPELHSTVTTLSLLALSSAAPPVGRDPAKIRARTVRHLALVGMLRDEVQGVFRREDFEASSRLALFADLVYPDGEASDG